jgi:hypothetical protein
MSCYKKLERSFVEKLMCEEVAMKIGVRDGISLSRQAGYKILKIVA